MALSPRATDCLNWVSWCTRVQRRVHHGQIAVPCFGVHGHRERRGGDNRLHAPPRFVRVLKVSLVVIGLACVQFAWNTALGDAGPRPAWLKPFFNQSRTSSDGK